MHPRYVENNSADAIYVAGYLIPAFSGRHIPVPPGYKEPTLDKSPVEAQTVSVPPAAQLLELSVKSIQSILHLLTIEQLQDLMQLESDMEDPRSTLVSALQKEILDRAQV